MEFKNWLLLEKGATTGKTGLYPAGYGGAIGDGKGDLLPPAAFMSRSADALYYLSIDDRFYIGKENKPFSIKHLPSNFGSTTKHPPGENWPFPISHIKGRPP